MKTIPTSPFDWFNFTAQNYNSTAVIQFVLRFGSRLDFDVLRKSFLHCISAEPVLGCVFHIGDGAPCWQPVPVDIDRICTRSVHTSAEEAISDALQEQIDANLEPPVKVRMLSSRGESEGDILVVKVHHALCDAGGALQYVRMLAQMYCSVACDPSFVPEAFPSERSTSVIYKHFGVEDKEKRFDPSKLTEMTSTWGAPTEEDDIAVKHEKKYIFHSAQIGKKDVRIISKFAKSSGCSVNSVLTAAYFRALVKLLRPSEEYKELQFSANLRRYADSGSPRSIANLSNMYNITLPVHGSFADQIKAVQKATEEVLEPENVLQSVLVCDLMSTDFKSLDSFYAADWENVKKSGLCTPMISNIGRLDTVPILFSGIRPTSFTVIPPAFTAPCLMLSISTYDDTITAALGYLAVK